MLASYLCLLSLTSQSLWSFKLMWLAVCLQVAGGVSSSGSWPALGEMALQQKTKKDAGDKSPPERVAAVLPPNTVDVSSSSSVASLVTALPSSSLGSQEISLIEKKISGLEVGAASGELSELEQQKLAGKKKGLFVCLFVCLFICSLVCSSVV